MAQEQKVSCEQQARDILERLGVEDAQAYSAGDLVEIANLIRDRERLLFLRDAIVRQNDEVTQTLAQAIGYPWYKDDQENFPGATEANGVCVGDHVAESLAMEAAKLIRSQRQEIERLENLLHNGVDNQKNV